MSAGALLEDKDIVPVRSWNSAPRETQASSTSTTRSPASIGRRIAWSRRTTIECAARFEALTDRYTKYGVLSSLSGAG